MTAHLAILLLGEHVADVERTRAGSLRLTYTRRALRDGGTPLSLSLPREGGSFVGERVATYLWGLLPESPEALAAIRRTHGADPRDPLSLLDAIGLDCAGAVQFCDPERLESDDLRPPWQLDVATPGEVEERLSQMRLDEEASWTMREQHWSLGGTQAKLTLHRREDAWFWPLGGAPSTHVVKPGVRTVRSQALIEHVTTRAAELLGLAVAHAEYLDFASERAVVSTRFDRPLVDGAVARAHQEDLCQALGVREKYEEDGGPTAGDIARLLRESAATALAADRNVRAFADGLLYNALVAAPDAHARNYAVLLDGDAVTLAPMYDVATGLAYDPPPGRDRELAMSVGGSTRADALTRSRIRELAEDLRLEVDHLEDRVRSLASGLPEAFRTALAEVEDWDGSVTELRSRLLPRVDEAADATARLA
ncbi:HipA domain-containing protein [Serinibacter salmoneus]|uniref:Serine/threonine-protein kinase HipA n=1 Tax=Serinibacter salmoneus TaxID=556530 RepID=A0A2A9CYM0_9MICO|nr:HipA domain-containing protein [Serinibacter salmoneus]PFG18710.1 serine/threonine-protein kinase HipA [Serinibacter salmoneus]